ncbi:hypothetical protein BKA83DRAFT_4130185 [Pisolithus microcarpus]|nr:hypothetical protein BKA83DRAFT_4130185 [Pisolithus microcarpus]
MQWQRLTGAPEVASLALVSLLNISSMIAGGDIGIQGTMAGVNLMTLLMEGLMQKFKLMRAEGHMYYDVKQLQQSKGTAVKHSPILQYHAIELWWRNDNILSRKINVHKTNWRTGMCIGNMTASVDWATAFTQYASQVAVKEQADAMVERGDLSHMQDEMALTLRTCVIEVCIHFACETGWIPIHDKIPLQNSQGTSFLHYVK